LTRFRKHIKKYKIENLVTLLQPTPLKKADNEKADRENRPIHEKADK
jgi:hypothetical protein